MGKLKASECEKDSIQETLARQKKANDEKVLSQRKKLDEAFR